MIDQHARERIIQNQRNQTLIDGLAEKIDKIVQKPQDTSHLRFLLETNFLLRNIIDLVRNFKITLPKIFNIQGRVTVDRIENLPSLNINNFSELNKSFQELGKVLINIQKVKPVVTQELQLKQLPSLSINNLSDLKEYFSTVELSINKLQSETVRAIESSKVKMPSKMTLSEPLEIKEWSDLIEGIEELKKGFNLLINKEAATVSFPTTSIPVEVQNWKVAQPVTHISLNSLNGAILSTQTSILTTPTPLPGSNLANRRSLIVYNNSSQTIYIGGSNVTVANGLPIPRNTYSPPMDAGKNITVYGIAGTLGGADCRVLEISDEDSGR